MKWHITVKVNIVADAEDIKGAVEKAYNKLFGCIPSSEKDEWMRVSECDVKAV